MQPISKHQEYGEEGIKIYSRWLKNKTANEDYTYELLATVDEFAPYDLLQIKRNNEDYSIESVQHIEIKTRNVDITDYNDCSVDVEKISKLQRLSDLTGNKCYLAAIYKVDRKIAIWEIEADAEYKTRETTCKWHTAAPQLGKRVKTMCVLPLSEAKIYNYQ